MNPKRQFAKSIREFMEERQSIEHGETVVNEEVKPSQVRSAISREKKKLMKRWAQRGGYENFGQKEVRALENKFKPDPFGSPEEREIATMIQDFDNWAMNYTGSMQEDVEEVNEELLNESGVTFRFDIDRKKYQFKFDLKKSPKGDGFIVTPQSMDDIYQLRQNIPDVNISSTIGRLIAKQIEKRTNIPVEYDSFRNNGYFIKIWMEGVIVRILQKFR